MKYTKILKEFLNNNDLKNRVFIFEESREAYNCYQSLLQYRKRHQLNYYIYYIKKKNVVLISKQELGVLMEYKDNINPIIYGVEKVNYRSKYARLFIDFLENQEIKNREIECQTLNQAKSCYSAMIRLRKAYAMEKQIRIKVNTQTKKVLIQKVN